MVTASDVGTSGGADREGASAMSVNIRVCCRALRARARRPRRQASNARWRRRPAAANTTSSTTGFGGSRSTPRGDRHGSTRCEVADGSNRPAVHGRLLPPGRAGTIWLPGTRWPRAPAPPPTGSSRGRRSRSRPSPAAQRSNAGRRVAMRIGLRARVGAVRLRLHGRRRSADRSSARCPERAARREGETPVYRAVRVAPANDRRPLACCADPTGSGRRSLVHHRPLLRRPEEVGASRHPTTGDRP